LPPSEAENSLQPNHSSVDTHLLRTGWQPDKLPEHGSHSWNLISLKNCTMLSCAVACAVCAGNDFDYTVDSFAQNFQQVEFLRETKPKDFLLAMRVKAGAAGKDIATNGLQDIAGLYITAITRPSTSEVIQDVRATFELQASGNSNVQ
jgi:hypothetical protein